MSWRLPRRRAPTLPDHAACTRVSPHLLCGVRGRIHVAKRSGDEADSRPRCHPRTRARARTHTHHMHTHSRSLTHSLVRAHTQSQAIIKRESDREEELMHQQAALKKALVKAKVSSHTYTDRS